MLVKNKQDSDYTALFFIFNFIECNLYYAYILCLRALLTLGYGEFDTLTFFQIAITITNDGIKMDENIIA